MSNRDNRPSPSISATTQSVGTQMQGNDGNTWEVVKSSTGVQRWARVSGGAKPRGKKPAASVTTPAALAKPPFAVLKGAVEKFKYLVTQFEFKARGYNFRIYIYYSYANVSDQSYEEYLEFNLEELKISPTDIQKLSILIYESPLISSLTNQYQKSSPIVTIVSKTRKFAREDKDYLNLLDRIKAFVTTQDSIVPDAQPTATAANTDDAPPFAKENDLIRNERFDLLPLSFQARGYEFNILFTYYFLQPETYHFIEYLLINVGNTNMVGKDIKSLSNKIYTTPIVDEDTDPNQDKNPILIICNSAFSDFDPTRKDYYQLRETIRDFISDDSNIRPVNTTATANVITASNSAAAASLPETQTESKKSNYSKSGNGLVSYLESKKTELGQLFQIRKLLSPIAFERKIVINQRVSELQKEINEVNFSIVEQGMKNDNLLDELFEQSFLPIKHEYQDVFAQAEIPDDAASFFAPNGSKSELSDSLNELIRTPDFMEWFGNWQLAYNYRDIDPDAIPCSKVISSNFEPLIVWHGTGSEFSYFRFETFPAAYFAVNEDYSKWFAELHGGDEGYTIPFFLNIRNPLDLTHFQTKDVTPKEFFDYLFLKTGLGMDDLEVNPAFKDPQFPPSETWIYIRNNAAMLKKLSQSHVFDGIHFYETNPSVPQGYPAHRTRAYIAFRADQCKIADPERGKKLLASLKSFVLKRGGKV